jgi:hypothetical protein
MIWNRGYWDCDDLERAYGKGKLDFALDGEKLRAAGSRPERASERETNIPTCSRSNIATSSRGKERRIGFWTKTLRWPPTDRWTISRQKKGGYWAIVFRSKSGKY